MALPTHYVNRTTGELVEFVVKDTRPTQHVAMMACEPGMHAWRFLGPARKVGHTVDHTGEKWVHPTSFQWTEQAGVRSHEVPAKYRRTDCDDPVVFVCTYCPASISGVCGTKDAEKCAPCELKYRKRVRFIAREPVKVAPPRSVVLLTTTAPGVKRHCWAHLYSDSKGKAQPSTRCNDFDGKVHDWCPCGEGEPLDSRHLIGAWNEDLGLRWNRLITDLRRGGALEGGFEQFEGAEYFKAVEPQKRGALHLHVLIRLKAVWVETPALREWVRELAVHHGFGHQVDLQVIGMGDLDHVKAARYVAKYVTKANASSTAAPVVRRPHQVLACDHETGDLYTVHDTGCDCDRVRGDSVHDGHRLPRKQRAWTASRRWGLSLGVVIASQRLFGMGKVEESRAMVDASLAKAMEDPVEEDLTT